jgi:hypothetical protein
MTEPTTGTSAVAPPADRDAYLAASGWTRAKHTWLDSALWHDPLNPDAAPLLPVDACRVQAARDAPGAPAPEARLLMKDLPSSAVVVQQLSFPAPDHMGCTRGMMVLLLAEAVPELVRRLGLTADELFTPTSGSASGRACLVVGAAIPNGLDVDNRSTYGPERSYPLAPIAQNTRGFSQPRRAQTERELNEIRLKAARDEAARQDYERHRRTEQDEKARAEAQKRASPWYRLRQLEAKLAELLGETQPPG